MSMNITDTENLAVLVLGTHWHVNRQYLMFTIIELLMESSNLIISFRLLQFYSYINLLFFALILGHSDQVNIF